MKNYSVRNNLYWLLIVLTGLLGLCAAVVAAAQQVDSSKVPDAFSFILPMISVLQKEEWWLSPLLYLGSAIAAIVFGKIGKPWVWQMIHDLLGEFRKSAFSLDSLKGAPSHHHRVTLFRYHKKYHWKCLSKLTWSDRLIPVERSGHLTQGTNTSFRINNDNPDLCEGVAGLTWVVNGVITRHNLPSPSKNSQKNAIKKYAKQTATSESDVISRINSGKPLYKSFCGIPVKKHGEPWGVIIIDSLTEVSFETTSETISPMMGHTFSKLIEKV